MSPLKLMDLPFPKKDNGSPLTEIDIAYLFTNWNTSLDAIIKREKGIDVTEPGIELGKEVIHLFSEKRKLHIKKLCFQLDNGILTLAYASKGCPHPNEQERINGKLQLLINELQIIANQNNVLEVLNSLFEKYYALAHQAEQSVIKSLAE